MNCTKVGRAGWSVVWKKISKRDGVEGGAGVELGGND